MFLCYSIFRDVVSSDLRSCSENEKGRGGKKDTEGFPPSAFHHLPLVFYSFATETVLKAGRRNGQPKMGHKLGITEKPMVSS